MSDPDEFPVPLPIPVEVLDQLRACVESAVRDELVRLRRRFGTIHVTVSGEGRIDVNIDWLELGRVEFALEPLSIPSVHAAAEKAVKDFASRRHAPT